MNNLLRRMNPNSLNLIRNLNKIRTSNQIRYLVNSTRNLCNKTVTETEEWYLKYKDYTKIGITQKAVEEMNEVVYLEYNVDKNDIVSKDDELVFLESVKSVESIKAPYDCIILDTNCVLEDNLEILNDNPESESESWILKIRDV